MLIPNKQGLSSLVLHNKSHQPGEICKIFKKEGGKTLKIKEY